MKTLDSAVLDETVQRLVDEFQPEQIILFGSRAWGLPDEDSDFDLLVIVGSSDVGPTERARRAYRSIRGLDVDAEILVKTRAEFDRFRGVPASLEHKICQEGKVLYG